MDIKEKKHRLLKEFYKGEVSTAFTLCLKGNIHIFTEPEIVTIFTNILTLVVAEMSCVVPV
jgi:hypothetical protein